MDTTFSFMPSADEGKNHLNYPFHWLHLLATSVLNPARNDLKTIHPEDCERLLEGLATEETHVQLLIKSSVFSFNSERKIALSIRRFHTELVSLLDQCLENRKLAGAVPETVNEVFQRLLSCMDGLLTFIETRFFQCLSMEEPCPATYLLLTRAKLQTRLDKFKERLERLDEPPTALALVMKRLYRFTKGAALPYKVTIRDVLYKKELMDKLEAIDWNVNASSPYSSLDDLLIYMNYNSKNYINLLTAYIAMQVAGCTAITERLDKLRFFYKAFKQLHRNPKLVLNPNYHDLEAVVDTWFLEEINYLRKKLDLPSGELTKPDDLMKYQPESRDKLKVLCMLSSDQAALILRAADELRVLIAKSMSEVFRSIVPHLSTPQKDDLSYKGVRSKAYHPEEKDKEIAIAAMERMIEKIKGY